MTHYNNIVKSRWKLVHQSSTRKPSPEDAIYECAIHLPINGGCEKCLSQLPRGSSAVFHIAKLKFYEPRKSHQSPARLQVRSVLPLYHHWHPKAAATTVAAVPTPASCWNSTKRSERGFSKMFFKDGCFRVYFLEVKKQKRGNPREEGPRVIPSQQCRTADLQLPGRFTTAQSRSLVRQLMRLPAEMTLDEAARTVRTGGFGFRVSFPFVFITLHTTKGEKKRIVNARTFSFIRPWKSCRLSQIMVGFSRLIRYFIAFLRKSPIVVV